MKIVSFFLCLCPQDTTSFDRLRSTSFRAEREHRYEEIVKNAKEKGLGEDVAFYLDFFKHGCPPHGGFAIGIDRLTMLLLNISSVKETQFIFRGPTRIEP